MQGRELAVGWEEWVDLLCLGRWPFFLVVSPVLCCCLCSVPLPPPELMFLETSALTGENVEEAFLKCARTILNKIDSGETPN